MNITFVMATIIHLQMFAMVREIALPQIIVIAQQQTTQEVIVPMSSVHHLCNVGEDMDLVPLKPIVPVILIGQVPPVRYQFVSLTMPPTLPMFVQERVLAILPILVPVFLVGGVIPIVQCIHVMLRAIVVDMVIVWVQIFAPVMMAGRPIPNVVQ